MSTIDQEFRQWGLHLLDWGGGATYEAGSSKGSGDDSAPTVNKPSGSMSEHGGSTVNDEAIAHVLQEELSRVASAEISEAVSSVPSQDWLIEGRNLFDVKFPPDRQRSSGLMNDKIDARYKNEGFQKETGTDLSHDSSLGASLFDPVGLDRTESGRQGGSSSPDLSYYEDDDNDGAIALVLSEEFSQQDGEVRKRFTHMESIPHIPKINGEIPTEDDATLDHQRLCQRLELYGLSECKIPGDGNCQFRALSDQLYRTSEHHKFVRKQIVRQLKACPESYEGYVPMKYSDYLKRMAKSGEWGDHVTLQAAADCYGVKICLVTSFKDTCFIEIVAKELKSERVIFLSFWSEVHYNSIYLDGDSSMTYEPKKKKHWLLF